MTFAIRKAILMSSSHTFSFRLASTLVSVQRLKHASLQQYTSNRTLSGWKFRSESKPPLTTTPDGIENAIGQIDLGSSNLNSQSSGEVVEMTSTDNLPSPEVIDLDLVSTVLNAAGEPCLQSLGLGSYWTPVGWMQNLLEFLHADVGLTWCSAIAACTLGVRLLMFPVVVSSQRNAAKIKNYTPKLTELQDQLVTARNRGDNLETLRVANELMNFMKVNEISPLKNVIPAFIQAPIFVSTFLAIRGLANFPLESMTDGGMLWFPNLSIADMFYVLPVITAASMIASLEIGFMTGTTPVQPAMRIFIRLLPLLTLPVMLRFSSAVVFYWSVNNFISMCQVGILAVPRVRTVLAIPQFISLKNPEQPITKLAGGRKPGFTKRLKQSWSSMKTMAEVEDRDRLDGERFKRAGQEAVIPTFKHDPTTAKYQQKPKK